MLPTHVSLGPVLPGSGVQTDDGCKFLHGEASDWKSDVITFTLLLGPGLWRAASLMLQRDPTAAAQDLAQYKSGVNKLASMEKKDAASQK